jgi:hypothetical protein
LTVSTVVHLAAEYERAADAREQEADEAEERPCVDRRASTGIDRNQAERAQDREYSGGEEGQAKQRKRAAAFPNFEPARIL